MNLRLLLPLLLFSVHIHADETAHLELPDSGIALIAPDGWVIKKQNGELGIYPPDQPAQGSQSRIHLVRLRDGEESLEAAIQAEIDTITERSPGSGNARENYKGSVPVKTTSGIAGLRADFHTEQTRDTVTTKRYQIVKYYFSDDSHKVFKVCAHVYGDEDKFKTFESLILDNLTKSNK